MSPSSEAAPAAAHPAAGEARPSGEGIPVWKKIVAHLATWAICVVGFGLIPVWIRIYQGDPSEPKTVSSWPQFSDLLLASTIMCAASLADSVIALYVKGTLLRLLNTLGCVAGVGGNLLFFFTFSASNHGIEGVAMGGFIAALIFGVAGAIVAANA